MEKIRGLYKITNEYSGLFYIGKSVDIYKRWITHKKDFENGTHSGGAFQYDYDVFGKEAFKFEILYDDENVTDIDLLIKEAQTRIKVRRGSSLSLYLILRYRSNY